MHEYSSDKEQLRATHDSKEEQQTKINQSSTKTNGFQMRAQGSNTKSAFKTMTKVFVLALMILLVVIALISLAAIVLSILLKIESEINQLTNNLADQLDCINNDNSLRAEVTDCGTKEWHRVAYLNMSDPSQQCPPVWMEYNTSQFRACGRPNSTGISRPSQIYPVGRQYSKVCGRVIGIQVASPDGFHNGRGINDGYMDGVSITTHGSSRKHIWSYVGSFSEIFQRYYVCPCDKSGATPSPSFVGANYYCESGNPTANWQESQAFPNDTLWDGQQCSHEGKCCTGDNTPPWFSVSLRCPKVTSDDIEVRIMGTESTKNEDTPIELLEIYVQ